MLEELERYKRWSLCGDKPGANEGKCHKPLDIMECAKESFKERIRSNDIQV